jgi:GT2 family glycosyltransferase
MFDLGTQPSELKEAPFGTNMAFRAEVFSKVGNFRTDLGPQPGSEIRGEDTDFGDRVLAAGLRMWYDPSAVVYHSLPAKRLQKEYFLRWWYDKARSDLRSCGPAKARVLTIAGVPLYAYRRLVIWTLRWLTTFNPARRFTNRTKVWGLLGMISEFRRMSRESSTAPGHTTA